MHPRGTLEILENGYSYKAAKEETKLVMQLTKEKELRLEGTYGDENSITHYIKCTNNLRARSCHKNETPRRFMLIQNQILAGKCPRLAPAEC